MATEPDLSSSTVPAAAAVAPAVKKDRHIVTWSPEEDDLLREQIALHGTDNWTIIAAHFKDKTSRQCRRRWYNYLNSECKKGGWSHEEDILLCEAQKVLGNRWTEIAKVVSGRTDNAVKNRFSTLCKKRAKNEELFKENGTPCSNANAKRIMTQIGCLTSGAAGSSPPIKQMRSCTSDLKENAAPNVRLSGQEKTTQQHSRQPLASISPNSQDNVNRVENQSHVANSTTKPLSNGEQSCVQYQGNFLKKDDPKLVTLLQQADLLSNLAIKINTENTGQSMDEAWQQLQDHLVKKEDNDMSESSMSGIGSLLEDLDDLIVDPYDSKEEVEQKSIEHRGQIDTHIEHSDDAPQTSMEVRSQVAPADQKMDNCPLDNSTEDNALHKDVPSTSMEPCTGAEILASENLSEVAEHSGLQYMEFTSPAHTVPTFHPYADGMPSPNFTASERNFLLSVLELTSPGSKPDTQQPSCKRALLDSL